MVIEYRKGDILADDAEALVNTVNCVGVMGRGIALQFKKAYPGNFAAYAKACNLNEVRPGQMFVFRTGRRTNPKYIINFPTKRHWRGKSRMEDIDAGLVALVDAIRKYGICAIAIPPLGSGLGGLNWQDVKPRIESALQALQSDDVHITIYEPNGGSRAKSQVRSGNIPTMTPGRAALVGLMDRYLRGLLDPNVSLLEVHKLMYFQQAAGESLSLRYTKGLYGPYAENLRHVLKAIEGYYIDGYEGGDVPDNQLKLVPGAVTDASTVLQEHPETLSRFERVAQLVEGFESAYGLELLATVHWIMIHDKVTTAHELVEHVYAWNTRKQQFTERQIYLAAQVLADGGWVNPLPQ